MTGSSGNLCSGSRGFKRRRRACWLGGKVRKLAIRGRRKQRSRGPRGCRWRGVLLFKADVSQVTIVDADDAVVLLEEALLLSLPSPLQTLDQQAKSPARFKQQSARHLGARQHGCRPLSPRASTSGCKSCDECRSIGKDQLIEAQNLVHRFRWGM